MYTIVVSDTMKEEIGDALLVSPEYLIAAIEALIGYWEDWQEQAMRHYNRTLEGPSISFSAIGVHCEVHPGCLDNYKPLAWTPVRPVIRLAPGSPTGL